MSPSHLAPADGTHWPAAISTIRSSVSSTLVGLAEAAELPAELLDRRPREGGWSAAEVLEHVCLTDHYLLLLLDKIADRSRRRLERGLPWPAHEPRFSHLLEAARPTFRWEAPDHMVPGGAWTPEESARRLLEDRARCLSLLDEFPEGEGTLHGITMSVVGGRLDLYQYLLLLALHAHRHLEQLRRVTAV